MHILLVEDDTMLAQAVTAGLRQNGWTVDWVTEVASAKLNLVDHHYSVVLLDLNLQTESGLTILTSMRTRYDATPTLIITARDQLSDRIRGLDNGADDYVVKPFQLDELYARIRAIVRRTQGRVSPIFKSRTIEVNPADRTVLRDGKAVSVSMHEYRTLLALMERKGRLVTREQLETLVYQDSESSESNTIAVFVHQLRKKLGDDFIVTVHGYGYRIEEDA